VLREYYAAQCINNMLYYTIHCCHMHVQGTMDLGALPNSPDERRATKRISLRIIGEAREAMHRPVTRRRGSVFVSRDTATSATSAASGSSTAANTPGGDSNGHSNGHTSNVSATALGRVDEPVHSGWLDKRRETGKWQKRWCVATETQLKYYHSEKVRTLKLLCTQCLSILTVCCAIFLLS
jgi:hypothetical protein